MLRRLLASAALASLALFPTASAYAERLHARSGSSQCADQVVDVRTWRPADGPAAEQIVKLVETANGTLFVGVGFDEEGFWSVEEEGGWDACDNDCVSLNLVHTTFAGVRTTHLLDGPGLGAGRSKDYAGTRRKNIKQSLFKLAKGPWKVSELSHDYKLRTPEADSSGTVKTFTGWFTDVRRKGKPALRFGLVDETTMCFCKATWRGYALAETKKK